MTRKDQNRPGKPRTGQDRQTKPDQTKPDQNRPDCWWYHQHDWGEEGFDLLYIYSMIVYMFLLFKISFSEKDVSHQIQGTVVLYVSAELCNPIISYLKKCSKKRRRKEFKWKTLKKETFQSAKAGWWCTVWREMKAIVHGNGFQCPLSVSEAANKNLPKPASSIQQKDQQTKTCKQTNSQHTQTEHLSIKSCQNMSLYQPNPSNSNTHTKKGKKQKIVGASRKACLRQQLQDNV